VISKWLPKPYRVYLSLGTEIALLLSLPIIIGSFVDRYFDIKPIGILSGVILGLILFFFRIVSLLKDPALDGRDNKRGDKYLK
tara:strand:+ start:408 stop:656 length:249 start_codon:yes stop_codon:yes gene_type:complete